MERYRYINKRLFAFLIDALFIYLMVYCISNSSIANPSINMTSYYQEEYNNVIKDMNNETDYNKTLTNISSPFYLFMRSRNYEHMYFILFVLLYYVFFQYFNNGQTLGKKLFGLKVVDSNTKNKASLFNLCIRSLFIGTILIYGMPLTIILEMLGLYLFNYNYYLYYIAFVELLDMVLEIININLLFNKSKCLHDYLASTTVIDVRPIK